METFDIKSRLAYHSHMMVNFIQLWMFCINLALRHVCKNSKQLLVVLFVFVALRPMSTAMVIAGQSVHLTTLFSGQA